MLDFLSQEQENFTQENGREAGRRLAGHLLRERQVGDLLKLDYNEATIQSYLLSAAGVPSSSVRWMSSERVVEREQVLGRAAALERPGMGQPGKQQLPYVLYPHLAHYLQHQREFVKAVSIAAASMQARTTGLELSTRMFSRMWVLRSVMLHLTTNLAQRVRLLHLLARNIARYRLEVFTHR